MLKHRLNQDEVLLLDRRYPSKATVGFRVQRNSVVLGIGGNLGDVYRRFHHLYWFFKKEVLVKVMQCSPLLINPPFGFEAQPPYTNGIMHIATSMPPKRLLRYLLGVEKKFRRRRSFPNAPRTLDIDILFYNDTTINDDTLTVPHPHWHKRRSVLVPLSFMLNHRG